MRPTIGRLAGPLLAVAGSLRGVAAQGCVSSGLDYTNGGSYNVDSTSSAKFSFTSVFQGCSAETIEPFLISPSGDEYACSAISTTPAGREQKSECGIPFSQMESGRWTIVLQGEKIATQRVVTITAGKPETVVETFTPTVVIGLTSTPAAVTVTENVTQTASLVLVAETTTLVCTDKKTVTVHTTNPPVTVLTTAVRTSTSGQTTVLSTTTRVTTAQCHATTTAASPAADQPFTIPPWVTSLPWARGRGGARGRGARGGAGRGGRGRGRRVVRRLGSLQDRAAARAAEGQAAWEQSQDDLFARGVEVLPKEAPVEKRALAATTVTVTARTTITSVVTSIATVLTKTEYEYKQTTVMVTPPVVTMCEGGNGPETVTAKATNSPVTRSSVVYVTTTVMATISRATTVQSTSYDQAKATQCWASGGWYGA